MRTRQFHPRPPRLLSKRSLFSATRGRISFPDRKMPLLPILESIKLQSEKELFDRRWYVYYIRPYTKRRDRRRRRFLRHNKSHCLNNPSLRPLISIAAFRRGRSSNHGRGRERTARLRDCNERWLDQPRLPPTKWRRLFSLRAIRLGLKCSRLTNGLDCTVLCYCTVKII